MCEEVLMKKVKIFFFGDSICVGQYIALHKGWVTRLSSLLSRLAEERGFEVIVANASANGRTTRQALEFMPYEVQSYRPEILIIQFGINDSNYWETDQGVPRVSPKAFAANLEEIIQRALTFRAQKIFLHTNHPIGRDLDCFPHTKITHAQSNQNYNAVIREVAAQQPENIQLNDIEKVFQDYYGDRKENLLSLLLPAPDLIHPSELGHQLYLNAIQPVLTKTILELVET
jgi:lysophospholipase L1-like esterase